MIVWRGWGILSMVIAFLALAAGQLTTAQQAMGMPLNTWTLRWHAAAALLIGAGANFWAGWRLNHRRSRRVVDTSTGRCFVMRTRHDLFFVPMEYWTIAFVLGAALLLLAS
jgi:hypothetical protein